MNKKTGSSWLLRIAMATALVIIVVIGLLPVIFMFAPLIVLSLLKLEDGAMVSVLLLIFATGLLLPQVLFVVGKKKAIISTNP
ncbi:MAG: hypothetical protein WAM09_12155 [Anaerolineales bacterium]|jgi:hypothetical protein